MSRILITGGLGFLGSSLVEEFANRGLEIRILGRLGHRRPDYRHPAGHEIVWADIREPIPVEQAVSGADIVVHTVSNFREARTDHEAHAINVGGTENVLRAAARHRVKRVVLCSTIGVHGNVVEVPSNESSPYNPGDVYQETKVASERLARAFEKETGIPVCILRPASLYGPGDTRMLKLFRMIQRRRFVLLGNGESFFHPAYITDVARAFYLAATHERAGGETFIVGGAEYLPLRDLIVEIARHLNVPPPRLRLPLGPVQVLAHTCELVCRPFGIEPPLHRRRTSFFRNNRAFSIEKARSLLGYEPLVSLAAGLEQTIAWYEAHGLLQRRPVRVAEPLMPAPSAAVAPEIHSADTR